MTDFHYLSKLPNDDGYWNALEGRILDDLGPCVREAAEAAHGWWEPLATHVWRVGMVAAAAGLAVLLLLPLRPTEAPAIPAGLLRLPDDDPALVAVLAAPAPPPLVAMLMLGAAGGER